MTLSLFFFVNLRYSSGGANELDTSSHLLTLATRELFNELDTSHHAAAPVRFWMVSLNPYVIDTFFLVINNLDISQFLEHLLR